MASRKDTDKKSSGQKRASGQQGSGGQQGSNRQQGTQGNLGAQGRERSQSDRRSASGGRDSGQMSEDAGRPQSWEGRGEWAGGEQTGQTGQERSERGQQWGQERNDRGASSGQWDQERNERGASSGQWGQERTERGATSGGRPSDQRRIGEDAWSEGRTQQRGMRDEMGGGRERQGNGDRDQRMTRRGIGGERQAGLSRGGLQQWSPFQDIGRAFGLGSLFSHPLFSRTLSSFEEFMPSTDVYVDGDSLVVKADLPGMSRDDVNVSIDNGDLVVSGERRHESNVDERNMYRSECAYGSFYRRVPLPQGADPEHVEARFRDGVLEVKVPLKEQSGENSRRVEIR
jgi:HSP20 family protein